MAKENPTPNPDFKAIATKLLERGQEKTLTREIFAQAERIGAKHGIHGIMETEKIPFWSTPEIIVRNTAEIILGNPDNVIALRLYTGRRGGPTRHDEFSISVRIFGIRPEDVIEETILYTLRRNTVLNIREQAASLEEIGEAQALLDYIESELIEREAWKLLRQPAQRA